MLEDLQKTFDAAFFNADHNLKLAASLLPRCNDQLKANYGEAFEATGSNLATMAFCFAQLLAKTILYSENYFVLKENYTALQLENYQLKSDKAFMDFVRKFNVAQSTGGEHNHKQQKKQQREEENNKPARISSKEMKQQYANFLEEQHPGHRMTAKVIDAHAKKSGMVRRKDSKPSYPSTPSSYRSRSRSRRCSTIDHELAHGPQGLERHFLGNTQRGSVFRNVNLFGRGRTYNRRTFCALYRHFKEVEYLANMERANLTLQKETCRLQSELANYRLVVCYLNNQLAGRIQQIQLAIKGPKVDDNFDQVWADLESGIQLNKFKTIIQALGSNRYCFTETEEQRSLFDMIHSNNKNNKNNTEHSITASSVPNSTQQQQQQQQQQPEDVDDDKTEDDVAKLKKTGLKGFHPSWFNFGLIRFVFVDVDEQGLGVAIIGGKEYGLPVLISQVYHNTPASRSAAFKVGDIILTVNFQDTTDMSHDEVVLLLKSLSGRCRFGVIYLKPTITDGEGIASASDIVSLDHNQQQLLLPNISSTATIRKVQLVGVSGGQLNTFDVANLCADYYRSTYNTLVALPVTMGNEAADRLSKGNNNDGDDRDHISSSSSSASSSSFSLPTSSDTSDDDGQEEEVEQKATFKLKRSPRQSLLSSDDGGDEVDKAANDNCVDDDKQSMMARAGSMTTVPTMMMTTTEATSDWMSLRLMPILTRPDGTKAFPGSAARV